MNRCQSATIGRITPVDAARGCAMLMVFLSHIKQHFETTLPGLYWALMTGTRVATPTFLLLSGFVIQHVLRTNRNGRAPIVLADRALFLLLIAHFLLGINELDGMEFADWILAKSMITDAVAVAMLIGIVLRNASARVLALIGATLSLLSWVISMSWTPGSEWTLRLGALLFKVSDADAELIHAPLANYAGVFLLGMALGTHLRPALLAGEIGKMSRRILILGAGAISIALAGILTWHFMKSQALAYFADPATVDAFRATFDPRTKYPPSPAYLLFYGGIGLLALALLFNGRPRALLDPLVRGVSVIGRTSLMCFIVQDWIFFGLPALAGLDEIHSPAFWAVYFVVAVTGIVLLARLWDRVGANRFFTVGIKWLDRQRSARAGTPRTLGM